jgi:hypothetical protein
MVYDLVADAPVESVTRTRKPNDPVRDGVPVKEPDAASVTPSGAFPLAIDHE